MIILFIGLPGAGKTTIAGAVSDRVNGLHINADDVRNGINKDLGFSPEDRVEQARRMGELARLMERKQDLPVIVDFVCPTEETRQAFGEADVVVWVDTIKEGRFDDTNKLWEDPKHYDHRIEVVGDDYLDSLPVRAITVVRKFGITDWKEDTVMLLGRYQPWHEGHRALYEEAKKRAYQVVIGVRHTSGMTEKDPLHFHEVKQHILNDVPDAFVVKMPNITNIVYGRDVGYKIEQVDLGADIHAISATQKRKEMGI
jgi:glycerol-3-phosphate cytidylyltransferase-like family protein